MIADLAPTLIASAPRMPARDDVLIFEQARPKLSRLAYRILGSR